MRISFVELAGFRGFKDKTRFEFPAGFVVLTGRNGAGKSTVLDAIDFALTGTIDKFAEKRAKGGGLDSHIWWLGDGQPSEYFVKVGFTNTSGDEFAITRTRDRGIDPSLEDIASVLCTGSVSGEWTRTLMQTTLIRDETLASLSMDLPEQARFEAVRAAIGGLTGPDHSTRTAALLSAAKTAKETQDEKVSLLQAELGRTLSTLTEARSAADRQPDVAEAEAAIKQLAPDLEATSGDLSEKLRRRLAERKQSSHSIAEIIEQFEALMEEAALFESDKGTAIIKSAEDVASAAASALEQAMRDHETASAIAKAEHEADTFASQMISLLSHGEEIGLIEGHCPLCDAVRSDSEFALAIKGARERLSRRGEAATKVREQLEHARLALAISQEHVAQARQRVDELHVRKRTVEAGIVSLNERLLSYGFENPHPSMEQLRQFALRRQEQTATLEHALYILEASGAHDRVSALEARIEQLRSALDAESMKVTSTDRAVEAARQIDNAAKTVANQVLTEQFDTVMPLLKELYLRLRPHTDWREIETDFGGKIRASLNFTVGEGRNPQFLFSSGQRRAAGLAFLLAIHLSRPWSKLQTLLLDDPVQHIDDYRALNLVEVLSAVRRLGRQVVVAVEDPALADLLCRRLRSTPTEGGCRYDLSMSTNGSAAIESTVRMAPLPTKILDLLVAS